MQTSINCSSKWFTSCLFSFYFKEREKDKIKLMFKLVCSLLFGIFIGDPWAIIDYRSGINQILITRELFAHTTETTNIDQILYYLNVLKK